MAIPNEKRTHWFEQRTRQGQRRRLCNGSVSGTFVTVNDEASKHQVDCSACVKEMKKREIA